MSFKAFIWAWEQDIPNPDYHHVLLALANITPARKIRASVPYIAKMVRRSPRKVRAALEWLETAGVLTREERRGLTDNIYLCIPADFRVVMDDDQEDDLEAGARGRPPKTPAKPLLNPCTPPADEPIEPQEPKGLVIRAPDHFDAWWEVYPRKTAKKEARKAWEQMAREIDALTPEELMIRTQAFAQSVLHKDQEHVPHGATWLRGERWNDELPDRRSQTDGNRTAHAHRGPPDKLGALLGGAQKTARRWTF